METMSEGPLAGLKIVDASSMVAGPMSTQILADQGAEVIKLEPPGVGDLCRFIGAMHGGISHYFCVYNRNKKSLVLDLKSDQGRELLERLLQDADAFVHNLRPDAAAKLGLDSDTLLQKYPGLICAALTGFGDRGPYAGRRVYDPLIQAASGIAATQGSANEPSLVRQLICDKVAGLYLSQALTSALLVKERTGKGQALDTSLLDTSLAFAFAEVMGDRIFVEPCELQPDLSVIYKPWRTADGTLAVVMLSDTEFQGWCRAVGCESLVDDERFANPAARFTHWQALRDECETCVASLSTDQIMQRLVEADVPAAPVNTPEQVLENDQVLANEVLCSVPQPGAGDVRHVRPPVRFGQKFAGGVKAAPQLGEDSVEILKGLGFESSEIENFIDQGITQTT